MSTSNRISIQLKHATFRHVTWYDLKVIYPQIEIRDYSQRQQDREILRSYAQKNVLCCCCDSKKKKNSLLVDTVRTMTYGWKNLQNGGVFFFKSKIPKFDFWSDRKTDRSLYRKQYIQNMIKKNLIVTG